PLLIGVAVMRPVCPPPWPEPTVPAPAGRRRRGTGAGPPSGGLARSGGETTLSSGGGARVGDRGHHHRPCVVQARLRAWRARQSAIGRYTRLPLAANSFDFWSMPSAISSADAPSAPASPNRSVMLWLIFIEQNFGPHIEQKWAVLAGSAGSVSSWSSRAVSGSRARLNWSSHRNSKRASDRASSHSCAPGCPLARSAAWAAIL